MSSLFYAMQDTTAFSIHEKFRIHQQHLIRYGKQSMIEAHGIDSSHSSSYVQFFCVSKFRIHLFGASDGIHHWKRLTPKSGFILFIFWSHLRFYMVNRALLSLKN